MRNSTKVIQGLPEIRREWEKKSGVAVMAKAKAKERRFQSSLKRLRLLFALGVILIGVMTFLGMWGLRVVPPVMHAPVLRALTSYVPFGMAGVLLVGLSLVAYLGTGKVYTLTPDALIYERRGNRVTCPWNKVVLVKPPEDKRPLFPVCLVNVGGARFTRIEKGFFPDYDLLISVIEYARASKEGGHEL